jgi:hypothetical protein
MVFFKDYEIISQPAKHIKYKIPRITKKITDTLKINCPFESFSPNFYFRFDIVYLEMLKKIHVSKLS